MHAAALLLAAAASTALAGAAVDGDRTATVYVQPVGPDPHPPVPLAEIKWSTKPTAPQTSKGGPHDDAVEPPPEAQVLSYEAPELADLFLPGRRRQQPGGSSEHDEDDDDDDDASDADNLDLQGLLLRVGLYDPAAAAWTSATTVARATNLGKGYAPTIALTVSPPGDAGAGGGEALAVALQGVAVDAGYTRDFGPRARLLRQQPGRQVDLGKPVAAPAAGAGAGFQGAGGKEPEEKTLLQKYWWVLAIMVVLSLSGGGGEEEKKK